MFLIFRSVTGSICCISQKLCLQILVKLIAKGGTVKAVIEEKYLVQVTELPFGANLEPY
jgi:hypothetical protein